MSWTEKLKGLISVHLPKLTSLLKLKITININSNNQQNKFEYSPEENVIKIDLQKLSTDERKIMGEVLLEAKEDGHILLEQQSAQIVRDIKSVYAEDDVQQVLNFIKEAVPIEDHGIWRAAIYLRARFQARQEIGVFKEKLIKKFGAKGKNIPNLCSAGYIESLLLPNFEFLKSQFDDEAVIKEHFSVIYRLVVYEMTVTIFVHSKMTVSAVKQELIRKINQNERYGIKFLNIHGIGHENLEKIQQVFTDVKSDLEVGSKIKAVNRREENNIVYIRIEI